MEGSDRSFVAWDAARGRRTCSGAGESISRPPHEVQPWGGDTGCDYLQPVSVEAAVTCLPLMPTTFGKVVPLICERITASADEPQTSGRR
jgi:hypothetical protein